MNYEFHVGDYVETVEGKKGYLSRYQVLSDGHIALYVQYKNEKIYPCDVREDDIKYRFSRIGAYDFTKKEKKKIEQLEDNLPVEGRIGDKTIEFEQYFSDGKYVKFVYNGKMIDKINELVNAVNLLLDKSTES